MNRRFLFSWIVVCAIWLIGNYAVNEFLIDEVSNSTARMMRPTKDQHQMIYFMLIAHILMAGAFVWIYQLRAKTQPWILQGLKFGMVIALLVPIPIAIIFFAVQQIPDPQAVTQVVAESLVVIAASLATAFIYRNVDTTDGP